MIFQKLKFIIVFVFINSTIYPQTKFINQFYSNSSFKGKFIVKQWTSENGLPQNSIFDIAQTGDGYLWLATSFGLVRFDGMNFENFNTVNSPELLSNRILTLAVDDKDGIWIGARNGKIVYYHSHKFIDYNKIFNTNGYNVNDIEVDKTGRIWIATDNDLFSYYKGKIKNYFKNNSSEKRFITVNVQNQNKVLIGTSSGMYVISNDKIISVTALEGIQVNSIISDNMGAFWVGCETGLFVYKNDRVKWQPTSSNQAHKILSTLSDSQKRLWIGTISQGLYVNTAYENCEFESTSFNSRITKIFEDKGGNIWVGTFNNGLFRITKRRLFSVPLKTDIFNNIIFSVIQKKNGEVWTGSFGGSIVRIKNGIKTYFTKKDGLIGNNPRMIYEDRTNKLWIGDYYKGLMYWNGIRFVAASFNDKLSNKSIYSIYQDSHMGLWVGTKNGLNHIADNKIVLYTTNDGLSDNNVRAIKESKDGTIWFSTNNGISFYKNSKIQKLTLPDTSKIYNCGAEYIDKSGRIWVGTYGQGLITYFQGKVNVITKTNGLFDNVALTILEDSGGYFWLSSNRGLFRVKRSDLIAFLEGRLSKICSTVYTKKDGILSNEFNGGVNNASCILSDGTLLFASMGGVVAVDPEINKSKTTFPNIFINKVTVNKREYLNDSLITIPGDENNVTLHFSAIKYDKPESINLEFRIDGYINNWMPLLKNRTYNLVNIPHGEYTVELREIEQSNKSKLATSKVHITVLPEFYQTVWFYLLLIFSLLGIIYFFVRLRIAALQANRLKLEKLVEKRTSEIKNAKENIENISNEKSELIRIVSHNLKNPIGVILNSSEWIIEENEDKESVLELSKIIKASADHMLESVKQLLQNEKIENLQFSLEIYENDIVQLINNVIDNNKVSLIKKKQKLIFDTHQIPIMIKYDNQNIMDALDNYIGNAIKYSEYNSTIKVQIIQNDTEIKISVIDEGPGLTEEDLKRVFGKFTKLSAKPTGNENSTGLGLSIVKKLIELHGGKVGVNSKFGVGSEFYFTLPLN